MTLTEGQAKATLGIKRGEVVTKEIADHALKKKMDELMKQMSSQGAHISMVSYSKMLQAARDLLVGEQQVENPTHCSVDSSCPSGRWDFAKCFEAKESNKGKLPL